MIISSTTHDEFQLFTVAAEPEDYDGYPPIAQLQVECWPTRVSAETVAVAGVLAFRPYISTLTMKKAISPTCARAVATYLGDDRATVQPVTLQPSAFAEPGHKELVVVSPDLGCPEPQVQTQDQLLVRLANRTSAFGFVGEFSTFQVASNAPSVGLFVNRDSDRRALALACAVTLAASMGCRGIAVVGPHDGATTDLVNSTGLSLRYIVE